METLRAEKVSYSYQTKYQKVDAVREVSCTFEHRKILVSGVCQVKCVSFFVFYQRPCQTADFCYIISSNATNVPIRDDTVVKRTVE